MIENSEYRIDRISKEKIKDLVYIFKSHKNYFTEIYFLKKFDTSFTGVSWVGYIAYHKETDEPAAYYGVFPVLLKIDDKQILAAQSGDTVTHSSHQKKGLFIILAQKTYQLCRDLNIQIVFGFPNQNSSHGFFNKLNWKRDGRIYKYILPNKSGIVKRIMRKLVPELYFKIVFHSFMSIKPSLQYSGQITVDKNISYLKYKKFAAKYVYSCDEMDISFKCDYDLYIGNIYFKKKINPEKLFLTLKKLANKTFTNNIVLYFSEFMTEHTILFSQFYKENEIFENGRLDLSGGYEDKHLVFSAEDFDIF